LTPACHHDRARRLSQNVKETTMTYDLDRTILELEAEARYADPAERRQIEAELGLARAERETILAEQDGRISAEPPF
jgi:hypothetical protein